MVPYGVELTTEGQELPATGPLRMKLDYSVDAVVTPFKAGVLSIEMNENQPVKVRIRNVILTVDPSKSGLEMIHLGVDKATMEIEDPAAGWCTARLPVRHPRHARRPRLGLAGDRLALPARSRADRGERRHHPRDDRGRGIKASLRGLDATLDLQPAISGRGAFQLPTGAKTRRPASMPCSRRRFSRSTSPPRRPRFSRSPSSSSPSRPTCRAAPAGQHRPRHLRLRRRLSDQRTR